MWLDDSHIDPKWIQEKLGLTKCTSCVVQDISNQMRVGARICEGATLRLTLTYDQNELLSNSESLPKTLIIKQAVTEESRAMAQQLGLSREALFYHQLAPAICTKRNQQDPILPKIYYSHGDMQKGSKLIVMEDLHNAVDSGALFGPGNPNNAQRDLQEIARRVNNPDPCFVAQITFEEMARIHAQYWTARDVLDPKFDWLRGQSWVQGKGRDSWEASQELQKTFWKAYENFEEEVGDETKLIQWDPIVRAALEKGIAGISWDSQVKRLNDKSCHWTLVHGDFWPGNVLYMVHHDPEMKNDCIGKIRLVDWEMVGVGSGPQELGQYVISNMSREDRQRCEEILVKAYHSVLLRNGVSSDTLTWEECWNEYKIGGVERWLWFLTYFLGNGMRDWAQFFHNQISEFMADHGLTADDITQPRP